ncbi:cuticle collagen 34-like [Perognathus longimembris pacificus]|uniref:cuticle collagen 34-like n=1 Tax=Perognathus longimembris pacificus TaxID=214514 RepID=UPI002019E348|nr:cuticle collagen 34-like [Perognathus longimembris pacificus]
MVGVRGNKQPHEGGKAAGRKGDEEGRSRSGEGAAGRGAGEACPFAGRHAPWAAATRSKFPPTRSRPTIAPCPPPPRVLGRLSPPGPLGAGGCEDSGPGQRAPRPPPRAGALARLPGYPGEPGAGLGPRRGDSGADGALETMLAQQLTATPC